MDKIKLWTRYSKDGLIEFDRNHHPFLSLTLLKKNKQKQTKKCFQFNDDKLLYFLDKDYEKCKGELRFNFDLCVEWLYLGKISQNKLPPLIGFKLLQNNCAISFYSSNEVELELIYQHLKHRLNQLNIHYYYRAFHKIEKGSFASVYLMQNKITSQYYAAKLFIKSKYLAKPDGKFSIENEILMLREVAHPNILQLFEVFETQHSIYLITNFLQGKSLLRYLEAYGKLNEPQVQRLMIQMLETQKYLFEKKIMHRDIKLENLLFDQEDPTLANLILIDFGLATTFNTNKLPIFPRCGTPGFVAPEIANNKENNLIYDGKCDIFSIGCVFHAMLLGKYAFNGSSHNEVFSKNKECKIDFEDKLYNKISKQAKDLLMRFLTRDPKERISAQEALSHDFFNICKNSLFFQQSYPNSMNNNSTLKTFSMSNNDQDNCQQSSENEEWKSILKQVIIEQDGTKIDYIKEETSNKNCFQDQMSCQQTLNSSYRRDDQTNISINSAFVRSKQHNQQNSAKKETQEVKIFEPPQKLLTQPAIAPHHIGEPMVKIPFLIVSNQGPNDSEQSSPFSPVSHEETKFGIPYEKNQKCIQLIPLTKNKQSPFFNQPIKVATLPLIKQTYTNNEETFNKQETLINKNKIE